jgi:hypothetical protein
MARIGLAWRSAHGTWNGSVYLFNGTFAVTTAGPVDATATVTGSADPMRLALLGYNATSTTGSACSTIWLSAPLPFGPTMTPPTITAHWDSIPAGAYCLNAVGVTAVPPYPPPYSWTVTITHP